MGQLTTLEVLQSPWPDMPFGGRHARRTRWRTAGPHIWNCIGDFGTTGALDRGAVRVAPSAMRSLRLGNVGLTTVQTLLRLGP
jgi:hypothetical protein